jgi:hypothetical protein
MSGIFTDDVIAAAIPFRVVSVPSEEDSSMPADGVAVVVADVGSTMRASPCARSHERASASDRRVLPPPPPPAASDTRRASRPE